MKLLDWLKWHFQVVKYLWGGCYPTVCGDHVLEDNNVDYIMLGHAEERISKIVRMIIDGDFALKREPGIGFREENNIVINPITTYIGDCKKMVKPDYSCVDLNPYFTENHRKNSLVKREASIITSYGCPYHCTFCAARTISGTKIVYRPIEDVFEEIEYLIATYHIDSIRFYDDNVLVDRERAKKLLKELKRFNIKCQFTNVAGWLLNDELIDLLQEAGCYQLCIPLESGSDRVLKEIMHKPLNKDIIPTIVRKCQERNIFVLGTVIIGLPGETWNEILETIRFGEFCNYDYFQINIATVLPKTEMYVIAKENHYLPDNFSFYEEDEFSAYSVGKITTEEFTPQELMIVRTYEWDRINFTNAARRERFCAYNGFTEEKLNEMRKEARRSLGLAILGLTSGNRPK